jgi:guanylate kinase
MGHIYALCGPSAVGKTTFLNALFSKPQNQLKLLARATGRKRRPKEKEGMDYNFYNREGFLQKIFSNDFVHVEQYGNNFYGIETFPIENAIASEDDAIIMAGIYGAMRLKAVFRGNVTVVYMYTSDRQSLLNPKCLCEDCTEIGEIKRRLLEKIDKETVVVGKDEVDGYVNNRMELNFLELAYVNGRIRSGENIFVLENANGKLDGAIATFEGLRKRSRVFHPMPYTRTNICFVLMPFKDSMKPIFDDHIVPAVKHSGLDCLRADKIFSNRHIVDDILDAVRNARIIISDLTNGNPNVFYETGICHAMGKEVILITQDQDVPFDLRHLRHIRYEYTPRGMQTFEAALKATIDNILST